MSNGNSDAWHIKKHKEIFLNMYFYRAFAPGMSFLRAMAAALWDSYSTKAKPRFFILSTALGYTITSTTPSVTCI